MNESFYGREVLTVVAALGVLITGLGAVTVNIIVALKTGSKIDVAAAKTEGLISQVKEVHTLTNSNLSAVKAELAIANALNKELQNLITDLKGERGKLAALTAAGKIQATLEVPAVLGVLGNIESNTAEVAENTIHRYKRQRFDMNILIILIVLLLVFGGGGFYAGGPVYGGSAIGLILIVLVILLLHGED